MIETLAEAVATARSWSEEQDFPRNPATRRLRAAEYIDHNGMKLKNAHRSDDALCDTMAGLIATSGMTSVLEIGTLFGFSTLHLAEAVALNDGHVTTIDLRQKSRKWTSGETVENIHELAFNLVREAGLLDRVTFVSGRSDVVMPQMTMAGDRFDLVFVDGSHSSHVVLLDLINALNLLRPGGMIVLDDVSENVALRDYNHGGPNRVLMNLLGSPHFDLLPLSYNTLVIRRRGEGA